MLEKLKISQKTNKNRSVDKLKKSCKNAAKKKDLKTCRESPIDKKKTAGRRSCDNCKIQEKKKKDLKKGNLKNSKGIKRLENPGIRNLEFSPIKKVNERFFCVDESSILKVLEILKV